MDFDELLRRKARSAPTDPRELWASLTKGDPAYGYLRDVQAQVLTGWHLRRDEHDLVVKVNTGAGKTIDGLLILQSYLNAGEGPALYVAPGHYLVEQVRAEAAKIGVATVEDPDDHRYLASEAIAVVTVDKLVNGKSVFSDARPNGHTLPIGSVVIDDAHAAVARIRENTSLEIPRTHPAFEEVLQLFKDALREQAPAALLDVESGVYTGLARVPFWAWRERSGQVLRILHAHRATSGLDFKLPIVQDILPMCRAIFTGSALTISPPLPLVQHISSLARAKHRIYLTATLADDSVLVTDFAAEPDHIRKPITPLTAGDIGERMILAPETLNPSIMTDDVRDQIAELSKDHNVVVLVPSDKAAAAWSLRGALFATKDNLGATVRSLRAGHVGIVVLANKYDGIDLPDDACRVLVIDGLPEYRAAEERLEAQLNRHDGADDRQIQRIEQGMGRAVRSNEDHCVVFLLGPRLAQLVADPRSRSRFSAATLAQLDTARDIAGELIAKPLSEIMQTAKMALERHPGWVRLARQALLAVPPPIGAVSEVAVARRTAFDAAVDGDYRGAGQTLSTAARAVDGLELGWLLEQRAVYVDQEDPVEAQQILAAARRYNKSILRPLTGVVYRRLSASGEQAQRAADFLASTYDSAALLRTSLNALTADLAFDPDQDRVEAAEEALRRLGLHLGLGAERPEKEWGAGPDVLWALGDRGYWIIEAKTGATTDRISKSDASQVATSTDWFHERYGDDASGTPVLIHPARRLATDATARPGSRVLQPDRLAELVKQVSAFAAALASDRWDDRDTVNRLITGHKLRASDLHEYLRSIQSGR